MRQTTMANAATIERKWYVVDATDLTLGRLASEVASVLRGKNKPTYTPHVDTGDYVIIINADKVVMTGKKLDKVNYSITSGGSSVTNGSTTATSSQPACISCRPTTSPTFPDPIISTRLPGMTP